jgi:hypothetical protein
MPNPNCPFNYPDCAKCAIQTACKFNPNYQAPGVTPMTPVEFAQPPENPEPEPDIEPKDIFEDFDTELFKQPPKREFTDREKSEEILDRTELLCPYYPKACHKVATSWCTKECEKHPDNYITDPKIKDVFDKEPWSNWCFTCGAFVPSRHHEESLDPPELVYSHLVATGYNEYHAKLREWVMNRLSGKDKK